MLHPDRGHRVSFSFSPDSLHGFSSLYLECFIYLTPIYINISPSKDIFLINPGQWVWNTCHMLHSILYFTQFPHFLVLIMCLTYSPNYTLYEKRAWVPVHYCVSSTQHYTWYSICVYWISEWLMCYLPLFFAKDEKYYWNQYF